MKLLKTFITKLWNLEMLIHKAMLILKENSEGQRKENNIKVGIHKEARMNGHSNKKSRITCLSQYHNEVTEKSGISSNLSTETCLKYVSFCWLFNTYFYIMDF